jgi:hypothetical protein
MGDLNGQDMFRRDRRVWKRRIEMKSQITAAVVVSTVLLFSALDVQGQKYQTLEAFPDKIQAKLENRDRFLKSLPRNVNGFSLEYVIRRTKRWHPGQTIRVSFLGGDASLRNDIATVAGEWATFANLKLDFGVPQGAGTYREWASTDNQYASEVRISFNQDGFWSFVGTDSVDSSVTGTGEASMNFGGFDVSRPQDWQAVVRHEFGHALGFEHEHQIPVGGCDEDFRWDNDPGYIPTKNQDGQYKADGAGHQPGLYTVLGGPPNNWPKWKVDANLRQLKESVAFFELSDFDVHSIMKYYFPEWMFRTDPQNPTPNHCYSTENLDLSDQDKKGVALAYPGAQADIKRITDMQRDFLSTLKTIPSPSQKKFELQMLQIPPH